MVDFNDLKREFLIASGEYVELWYLGDSSGQIYDSDGLIRVARYDTSGNVIKEKSVRGPTQGAVPMDAWGIGVLVGFDEEGKEAIKGISFSAALQQGFPPGLGNAADINAYGDVLKDDLVDAKATPTLPPGLYIAVQGYYYIRGRQSYSFLQDRIDVSSLIPGDSDTQRVIGVQITRDGILEAKASTAQDVLDPLDNSDIDEILIQFEPGGIPVKAFWVNDQTTVIDDSNIFQDLRPLWMPDMRDLMSLSASSTLTISGGSITSNRSYHLVAAESGTEDDLETIVAVEDRQLLILQADSGDTITVKHNAGNITLNGEADVTLTGSKTLLLFYDGTAWSDTAFGGGGYADSGYWYVQADSGDTETITDGDTFTVSGDGSTIETETQEKGVIVSVKDGGIDTSQLADGAVTKTQLDAEVYAEPDDIGSTTPASGTFTVINIVGNAATVRTIDFLSDDELRWSVLTNDGAEAGSNAGSNFEIRAYEDNGTLLRSQLVFNRATGLISLANSIGLSVTPRSDWHTQYRVVEFGQSSIRGGNSVNYLSLMANAYYNTSGEFRIKTAGVGSAMYDVGNNTHIWYIDPAGDADDVFTPSVKMILTNTGLGVGEISPTAKIDVYDPTELGSTLDDEQVLARITEETDGVKSGVRISLRRLVAGTTHRSAALRWAWSADRGAASQNDGRAWFEMGNASDSAFSLAARLFRWGVDAPAGSDGTEWMRLQNGHLLLGVSSETQATGTKRLVIGSQIDGSATPNAEILLGQQTSGAAGNVLGQISFGSLDASSSAAGRQAAIKAIGVEAAGRSAKLSFFTGTGTEDSSVERMSIAPDGDVSMSADLSVTGSLLVSSGMTAPALYSNAVTGRDLIVASDGEVGTIASSRRFKDNIIDIPNVDWLDDLRVVEFNYRPRRDKKLGERDRHGYPVAYEKTRQYGGIAEEWAEVNEKLVSFDQSGQPETIHYRMLIPVLLKAIQDLRTRVAQLEAV